MERERERESIVKLADCTDRGGETERNRGDDKRVQQD